MSDSNPTGVSITLHTFQGQRWDHTFTITNPCHYLGPFVPMTIRTITVGSRATMYANVIHNVEGANVISYIHLRSGTYTYAAPIQLLTLHIDTIA